MHFSLIDNIYLQKISDNKQRTRLADHLKEYGLYRFNTVALLASLIHMIGISWQRKSSDILVVKETAYTSSHDVIGMQIFAELLLSES